LAWTLGCSIPFLAALTIAYVMSVIGLIARPTFPFDPQSHPFGIGAALVLVVLLAALVLAVIATRRLTPPLGAEEAFTPAVGLLIYVSIAAIWIADPYLALLLVPTAHLWLAAALPELRGRVALTVLGLFLGL